MRSILWATVGVALGFVLGHGMAWAQVGTSGPPQVTDVWNTLITSGPLASLLGFILWRVDSERRQLQKERDALLERVLTGLNNGASSIASIAATNASLTTAFASVTDYIRSRDNKGL